MLNVRTLRPSFLVVAWRPRDWQYAPTGARDLRLDLLRGYAVFAMIVDHLGGTSWLQYLTGGNRFFVSAAEGFVFISGLLIGIIYGDLMRQHGWQAASRKALARAWTLYRLTVPLTLLFVGLIYTLQLPFADWYTLGDPWKLVFDVATLQRTFVFTDIPLLYTQLLLLAPAALWLLNRGLTRWMLATSFALWGAYQLMPESMGAFPWVIEGNWLFHTAAWQLLFFVALALGYHRGTVARRAGGTLNTRNFAVLLAATIFLAILSSSINPDVAIVKALFGKANLAIGRLLSSVIVFATLYTGTTLFWKPLDVAAGWLFIPLGANSLYGYTLHVMWLVAYYALVAKISGGDSQNAALNSVLQAGAVLLTWQLIRSRFLFRVIPR